MPDTRYRVTLPPLEALGYVHENGVVTVPPFLFDYWLNFESIVDSINPIKFGTDNHRPPGSVVHNKVNASKLLTTTSYLQAGSLDVIEMGNHAANVLGIMYPGPSLRNSYGFDGWLNLLSRFEDSPTFRNLCITAFNKQITQVPAKTSVINFAFELLELKPIFKSLAKIPDHIRRGSLSRAVTGRRLSKMTPVDAVRGSASAFLAAEFQWLPFVSDIYAFIGTMDAVTKRLDYLRKTKGKETTVRFVKEDCFVRPEVGSEVFVRDDTSEVRQAVVLNNYQCDFVSTWKLFQDLEGLDDAWASLRATFAYLGVNNPAKIVWNAIPFSFLVDWVSPVSEWLSQAAVQPFYGTWNVYDATCSVHEKYSFDYMFTGKFGGTSGPEFKVGVDSYRRLNYLPLTLGDIDFTQLTDTQQKLAFSLVVAKKRA